MWRWVSGLVIKIRYINATQTFALNIQGGPNSRGTKHKLKGTYKSGEDGWDLF